jgi:hypothetical protein
MIAAVSREVDDWDEVIEGVRPPHRQTLKVVISR